MDDVGWSILLMCVLAVVSMFFSLNHVALRTFSRVKIAESFKSLGREDLVDVFFGEVEKLTLTCSLLRLVSNVGVLLFLLMIVLPNTVKGYILFFVLAIIIFEVFSVAVPHSWAKYTGETVLARTYKILRVFSKVVKPVLVLLDLHDRFVRRLAGVTEMHPEQAQEEKQEELLSVVEQGKLEGVVDEEEMEMIENVLELSDTTAEEIMTPRTDLVAVNANDSLEKVLETISTAGHSRIPVYEENIDNIIGLVYAKDLLAEIGKDMARFKLRDKMRKAYFVPETKPLRVLLHEFQNQKLHIAVVLDEYGGTAGVVTIEDILEELVGEIVDEYEETPTEEVKRIDERTIEIDARMYIDDLNEEFDVELPEDEDYDTAGGFVFSHLGYIPKAGISFEHEDIRFVILAAEARRIIRLRIEKLNAKEKNGQ
ncbi:MAG: HlyC/CorC family transporter [Anaerohalosphaera sp.]|nr:HlyC/CorC family transporter [Anaerohalosphaera sp.]